MIQGKLECTEVIESKEQIQHLGAYGQIIFAITHGHGLKVMITLTLELQYSYIKNWRNLCWCRNFSF